MLVFTPNIIFVNNANKTGTRIYNISSSLEGYDRLISLTPPRFYDQFNHPIDFRDQELFGQYYTAYVLSNKEPFMALMDIVYNLYEGYDVLLLIGRDEFRDILTETISKIIQQRYGYISNIISDLCDLEGLQEGQFSIQGLYTLDQDKEIYINNVSRDIYQGGSLDDYD
jgi:hypothetical protein